MFSASWNGPCSAAPSPKKHTRDAPFPSICAASAAPAAMRHAAADDAVGAEHAELEVGDVHRAALALAVAVARPKSSAIMRSRSAPLAMQWPWPRCVMVIWSSARQAAQTPTATASWPM